MFSAGSVSFASKPDVQPARQPRESVNYLHICIKSSSNGHLQNWSAVNLNGDLINPFTVCVCVMPYGNNNPVKDDRREERHEGWSLKTASYEHFSNSSASCSSRVSFRGSSQSSQEPPEQDLIGNSRAELAGYRLQEEEHIKARIQDII